MHQQRFRECLSVHDQTVLETLFSPLKTATSDVSAKFDIESEVTDTPEEPTAEVKQSKQLELEGIQLTEAENLDAAIVLFERAIRVAPNRASVYNNRAQALRLKGNDEDALDDLRMAIELSAQKPRTKCQALCQRGLLRRKLDNIDGARSDFEEAAKLGSKFAKTQLVEINPYAALCNQMLQAAFTKMV